MTYFKWLHSYQTCCLTGRQDIQIAHTGGLAQGKGMALKSAVWTCLPLSAPLHWAEERGREDFWFNAGFQGEDRFHWSIRLHEIYQQNDDPTTLFADMQLRANRAYLATILEKVA